MGPEQEDLAARLRAGLARVRWENVALLLLVVVAVAGVVMSGALTGRGPDPLPDDVGVREQFQPPARTPRPHPREIPTKTDPTREDLRHRKRHRTRDGVPARGTRPAIKAIPVPPPPAPPPAAAGSEFAPD